MREDHQPMTAEGSLTLIASMISQAKGNFRGAIFFFLLWGWVVCIAYAAVFVMYLLEVPTPWYAWLITIPAWIITFWKSYRMERTSTVTTHFDSITRWVWYSFGLTILTLIGFGFKINYQITPVILVISAIPTLVSGIVLRFRPLLLGGALFWVAGIGAFLVSFEWQPLFGAAGVLFGYLVPAYLLKGRKD